jgi:Tfp pilus assembly protein PilZ
MDGMVKVCTNGRHRLGELRDISQGGLSVSTSTPYQVGYELFVSVELPETIGAIAALAEVVWVHPLELAFHPIGMGLRFLELNSEDLFSLKGLMELA